MEDGGDLLVDSIKGFDCIVKIVSELESFLNVDCVGEEFFDFNDCVC